MPRALHRLKSQSVLPTRQKRVRLEMSILKVSVRFPLLSSVPETAQEEKLRNGEVLPSR